MAEPPHAWTVPGEEPDDRDPWGNPPVGTPPPEPPAAVAPPAPTSGDPNDPGLTEPTEPVVTPPLAPWGAPPAGPQPNWGPPPPGQPNQWGAQPGPWGGAPNPAGGSTPPGTGQPQWSGAPVGSQPPWGGQPPWGSQPPWGGQPQAGGASGPGNWNSRGPGIVPIRPLMIGEIYDGAIRAIRSNPRTMVGFAAIVIAVLALVATAPQAYALTALLGNPLLDPTASADPEIADIVDALGATGLTALIGTLQFVLATTIVSGLLIVAVDGAVRGQSLNPSQLWARCRSRLLAVLGLACVVLLVFPLLLLLGTLPGVIVLFAVPSGEIAGALLMALGVLVGTLAFFVLYFGFWAVAAPALLLEKLGPFSALGRSYQLVRGSFWRVFGIGLLTSVIAYIIRQVFNIPFTVIGGLVGTMQGNGTFGANLIQLLIADIGTVLAGAVLFPFTAGVAALLYLDLRMRREGLDVDLMRS